MVLPSSNAATTNGGHDAVENPSGPHVPFSTQPSSMNTATATSGNPATDTLQTIEEQDFIRAVQLSLQDQAQVKHEPDTQPQIQKGFSHCQPSLPSSSSSSSWCEPSVPLVLSLNNEFTPLNDQMGDTAIYFGFPPQMPEQNDKDYQYIKQHFDRVHVVQSTNLRLMGQESRFAKELSNPTKLYRAERKLRKLGVLSRAEAAHGGKFKYYIDLRPPHEDEEAVILITDQTCTRGVLTWYLAMNKYGLSPLAVLGHDEFGVQPHIEEMLKPVAPQEPENSTSTSANTTKPRSKSESSSEKPAPPAPKQQISPEYSPLRHWSALERVLQAIQGNDPKLDSAPKVWTFFAVARYFGCATHERISGWIMTWLYAGNNSNFIQNNPEVAYRIGLGIKSPDLIKDSFSILVGERALVEVCGEFNPEILTRRRQSVHGRKLELLDDDERNRIDHAASSFVKRIREIVCSMCQDMDFLHDNAAYAILENAVGKTQKAMEVLKSTKTTVREYISSRIYYVLCQDQGNLRDLEPDPKSTLSFRSASGEDYSTVYRTLNQQMRHFTKTFWIALQYTQFDEGTHSTSNDGTIGWKMETKYHKHLQELHHDHSFNGVARVARSTFERKINLINQMFHYGEVVEGKRSPKRRKTNEAADADHAFRDTDNARLSPNVSMHATPSWRCAPPGPAPGTEPPVFPLRPNPMRTGGALQDMNNIPAYGSYGKRKEIPIRPKETVPATLQADSPPIAPVGAADTSSSSASDTFFNPYTGRHEEMNPTYEDELAPRTPNRIKQAFSNTNTDHEASRPLPPSFRYPIDPAALLTNVSTAIETICSRILFPPHLFHQTGLLPTDLYDNLLCLTDNEFRYLPLWVPGGNDDGTGGVYEGVPVPNLDPIQTGVESFGPGRIKRGFDQAETAGSDFDEISSSQAISTVGKASKLATDGTRTVKSVSSASTTTVKRETACADLLDNPAVIDHNVVHVDQVPSGTDEEGDTDMLDDEDLDDEDEDATAIADGDEDEFGGGGSDSDGFNWDDEPAGASPTDSKVFEGSVNQDGADHQSDQGQAHCYTQTSTHEAHQEDIETIPHDAGTDTATRDSGKGKAKAQNFPHGFVLPDLPRGAHDDPATETEQQQTRPLPQRPHPHRIDTSSSSSSSVVLIDADDDFEFI
ncbi:hypothetical protein AYL99_02148 [Fonsecaea erecta]|uniref:Uncharacterized protein n=1 Tax=Fonsecaea erecta TaxID=1367422 RepID=A0A178ZU12_9EURO|nr:hypothetical protein AYL99_02148 [Fonsecaea erecta]OAP62921.1 hypothetical protein AYL99_02148 [Fonsecaea erecta]